MMKTTLFQYYIYTKSTYSMGIAGLNFERGEGHGQTAVWGYVTGEVRRYGSCIRIGQYTPF